MDRIIRHFSRQSTFSILFRSYLTVILIVIIDYSTGPHLSMLVLYLIPIIITSWFVGRRAGFIMSIVSTIGCFIHDILHLSPYSYQSFPTAFTFLWNPGISFCLFIIVTSIISSMRKAQDEKLKYEFQVAAEVQSRLFPQSLPRMKTLDYKALCKPTTIVSGDYYDFLLIEPSKLGIAIGDICGKGISAALLMANLQGLLRSFAKMRNNDVAELMGDINRALFTCTDSSKFATLFYGIYDDLDQTLTYINAGHNPPIILKRKNGKSDHNVDYTAAEENLNVADRKNGDSYDIIRIETGGTVVGSFPHEIYKSQKLQLHRDDILIFYTDGLIDARNFLYEQYGEGRLTGLVESHTHESPHKIHDIIFDDVNRFTGGEVQFDDMTLVVAKVV